MTAPQTLRDWFGTDEPPSRSRLLRAGDLTAELIDGNLRNIRFDGVEVLRAIAYVVRDKDWGTYAPTLDDFAVEEGPDEFRVGYNGRCKGPQGRRLNFEAIIQGDRSGTLRFDVTAIPDADFETNRCGFCILHPIRDLAGQPAAVEHTDGTVERSAFPDLIDPWQPFKDIRAITHAVRHGLEARCLMEGDAFETEDQRNWTDASYKTYVRPIERPWPYLLPAGIAQRQAVTLTLVGDRTRRGAAAPDDVVTLTPGHDLGPMPGFAIMVTPEEADAVLAQAARLIELAPQTLLFHFDPTAGHDATAFAAFAAVQAIHSAEALLEYVAPCVKPLDDEMAALAVAVRAAGMRLDSIVVSPAVDRRSTPPGSAWPVCPPLADLYAATRRHLPGVRLGGGMISTFTELNRKRPPFEDIDFVTHCTNPIVHAADDRSVMETLEALPFVTRSVRAMAGPDKPYRIGPSTIGMRQNPYGARVMPNPDNRRVTMSGCDPRQTGQFAAAWMIGHAAQTAEARLESFCGGALTGDFGMLHRDGHPRPVFEAAKILADLAGKPRRACVSSHPDRVLGLAVETEANELTIWVASIVDSEQPIRLLSMVSEPVHDQSLFSLAPFEVCRP